MKNLLPALAAIFMAEGAAHADVMKTDFTAGRYPNASPIVSVASLTLSLNTNGTIAAELDTVDPDFAWSGLGINSKDSIRLAETNFSQGGGGSWGTPIGSYASGVYCEYQCYGDVTFTLGSIGQFTSVEQVLGGPSSYDAAFFGGYYYAGRFAAAAPTNVPEPASAALIVLGLAGVAITRRHSRARA